MINNFVYIFYMQLCLSLFALYGSERTFTYHNNLSYVLQRHFFKSIDISQQWIKQSNPIPKPAAEFH